MSDGAVPYMEMKVMPSLSQAGWNPITAPELTGDESQPKSYRSNVGNPSLRASLLGRPLPSDDESFLKRNKKKVIWVSVGVCCFLFVVIAIGLAVPLIMLTKTSISPVFSAEIFSLCETSNLYQFNSSLHNPSAATAELLRSQLYIYRTNDSRLLFTTWVPHVTVRSGNTKLSIWSNLTVENETAVTELLNEWLRGDWIGFRILLDANLKVWGIKLRLPLDFKFVFPGKVNSTSSSGNSSAITLDKVTVLNSTADELSIAIGLDLNYTSTVIIHTPVVALDLMYNQSVIGNVFMNPLVIRPGITALDTALLFPRSTVDATSAMAYNMANGDPLMFVLMGSTTAPTTCMLQRVLRNVSVDLDLSDSAAPQRKRRTENDEDYRFAALPIRTCRSPSSSGSFVLGSVELTQVASTNITLVASFSTTMPVYGQLPSIVLEYFTEVSKVTRIGVLQIDIAFNGPDSRVYVTLGVEQFPQLGSWVTSVTATPRNELAAVGLLPSRTWVNMATGILQRFSWNFPLFSGTTAAPTSDPPVFTLNRIAILGNPLGNVPNVVAIGADFSLRNERFVASFPQVNVTVSYSGTPMLLITLLPLRLTPGVNSYSAEVQVFSLNPGQVQSIVDDAWQGSTVALTVLGDAQYAQLNVLQKVLSYWQYQYAVITAGSQTGNGSETVKGGVMPKADLHLGASTRDTIGLGVAMRFNSPLDFGVRWGLVQVTAAYNASAIINGSLAMRELVPGPNQLVANVSAFAIGSLRTYLEDFVSRYAFQRVIPNIELSVYVSDATFKYAPVMLRYGFTLPAGGGGSSSGVMRCTEIGQANPGLDLSTWGRNLLLGNFDWPACTIDSTLSVWFSNPLPFPMTIRVLQFDMTFQDPDGLVSQPFKLLTYIPGVSKYFQPDMNSPYCRVLEPHTGTPDPSDPDGFGARPAGTQLDLPLVYQVNQLAPFNLLISTKNQSPITGTPESDPHYVLCIRLAEQYYNDKLTVDMRNGIIELGLDNFVISLSFEMLNYFVGGKNTVKVPCRTQLGLPN